MPRSTFRFAGMAALPRCSGLDDDVRLVTADEAWVELIAQDAALGSELQSGRTSSAALELVAKFKRIV